MMCQASIVWIVVLLLAPLSGAPAAHLRNVTLQIARTNPPAAVVSWQSKSAVPAPGRQLFPDYQLETSDDLTAWWPLGAVLPGTTNNQPGTLRALDPAAGERAFYRVKSIIHEPFADFNRANLAHGELQGADFFGADFFAATLTDADLRGADLRGTDLRFADLSGADLGGADLFGSDLVLATLQFTLLEHADVSFSSLEGADFFGGSLFAADLRSTILTAADLRFVTLHRSLMDANTLIDSKWRRVWQIVNGQTTTNVFLNSDLGFADLREADLRQFNLSGSDLSASDLGGADLRGANLNLANLRFVAFDGALVDSNTVIEAKSRLVWEIVNQGAVGRDLHGTNLSNAFLADSDMRRVNLTNANLNLAILPRANLGEADLRGATLTRVDFSGAILTNAMLHSANFSFADLTQANLFGATTNGALFTGTTFNQTIMPDGSIR